MDMGGNTKLITAGDTMVNGNKINITVHIIPVTLTEDKCPT